MKNKHTLIAIVLVTLFLVTAPLIPLPIEMQKIAMSLLYSDESYANDIAIKAVGILNRPRLYGFSDQKEVFEWLNEKSWTTPDGGSRRIYVVPVLLGDMGWPTVVSALKVTLVYERDGSRATYQYSLLRNGKI